MIDQTTDLSYLRSISDNDKQFIKEMIDAFLEMTPVLVAQMRSLAKEKRWVELGKTAHQMKPSLQFMGMEPTRQIIREIEEICSGRPEYLKVIGLVEKTESACNKACAELKNILENGIVSSS